MAKIYISSTFRDLQSFRKAVDRSLRRIQQEVVAMEYYVSENKRPLDKCLEDVRQCDFYIGIFAWRYGFIPEGHEKSITELEYLEARKFNKECLIFLSTQSDSWQRDMRPDGTVDPGGLAKITRLREELMRDYSLGGEFFENEHQLATNVVISLFDNSKLKKIKLPASFAYYCDRVNQSTEFMDQYRNPKLVTPVFIVEGENDQSHHGLVLRFAFKKFKIPEDQVITLYVQQHYQESEYKKFLTEINHCLGIPSEDFDGQLFMDRFRNVEIRQIFLVFKVHQSFWNSAIVKNINAVYQTISDLMKNNPNPLKVHFFVNAVYESTSELSFIDRFKHKFSKHNSRNHFKLINQAVHLPELKNVDNLELRSWLDEHLSENSALHKKLHTRYGLSVNSKYPMSEIELFLARIISDFNSNQKALTELGLIISN